jgi:pyrimidine operon attenuation protein/uracil phosphoribosyltransferase
MKILSSSQVARKIKRLAIEIYSNHLNDKEIYFVGINQKGVKFAEVVGAELSKTCPLEIIFYSVKLNPSNPLRDQIKISTDIATLSGKKIIIFDDVANTGRTIFYACKPFLEILPERLEIAALVDRKHKLFPIHVDYVGLSLATTLHNNIEVIFNEDKTAEAYLS